MKPLLEDTEFQGLSFCIADIENRGIGRIAILSIGILSINNIDLRFGFFHEFYYL